MKVIGNVYVGRRTGAIDYDSRIGVEVCTSVLVTVRFKVEHTHLRGLRASCGGQFNTKCLITSSEGTSPRKFVANTHRKPGAK